MKAVSVERMILGLLLGLAAVPSSVSCAAELVPLSAIPSPIIFRGDATTAYRDPAVIYHDGWFRLFFTLVKIEPDERPFSYTAWSKSRDLIHWTDPTIFTPRDQRLNYGSPGNIVRYDDEWVLCLQTYPRPNGEKYGNSTARIWTMRSKDLETWGEPELIRAKGPDVPQEKMGRMIDAFLLEDKDDPGKWWCFYKQNGVSMSWSHDLKTWTYGGRTSAGENACVIVDRDDYVLFHSPGNGVGVKRSRDLKEWRDEGVFTLGQKSWPWAQGRLTAGFVLDLRKEPSVGKALMFFHGSDFPERDPRGGFDNFASIGLAWSDDLQKWAWPGKAGDRARVIVEPPPLDPAGTWVETPWAQPVVDRGAAGDWDHYAVDNPYVHAEDGKFYCFFEAQDKPFSQGGHEAFGLAVSSDGCRWEKLPGNPILNVGKAEAWDSVVAKLPAGVIKRNGLYHLFYSGLDARTKQIGLATASKLTGPWTKAPDNPVLKSRLDRWDAFLSTYPAPVFDLEGNYYLLFRGMKTRYRRQGAGLAVSADLRHWRRCTDSPLIPVTEEMASLAVVQVGGRFIGISQPTDLGQRRYWFSSDLKHWQKGPPVNFRASVQAETLSNPFVANGRWTVLYEQKDRIYRAVLQPAS